MLFQRKNVVYKYLSFVFTWMRVKFSSKPKLTFIQIIFNQHYINYFYSINWQIPHSFNSPEWIYVNDVKIDFPLIAVNGTLFYGGSSGLRYEAMHVRQCLIDGKLKSDVMTHNDSILIWSFETELRRQVGVKFDVDTF